MRMRIGGLQKVTLLDYPGKVACTVFLPGCNLRCPFCHNPALVLPDRATGGLSTEKLLAFLETRRGKLDGVCVTGGEPTLYEDLPALLRQRGIPVRDVPIYTVRTDMETAETAGEVLETLDYLAFSSAGGVERYFAVHGAVPEGTACVCIGGVTAGALRARYQKPFLTAAFISAEGIAETILEHRNLHGGEMLSLIHISEPTRPY